MFVFVIIFTLDVDMVSEYRSVIKIISVVFQRFSTQHPIIQLFAQCIMHDA